MNSHIISQNIKNNIFSSYFMKLAYAVFQIRQENNKIQNNIKLKNKCKNSLNIVNIF